MGRKEEVTGKIYPVREGRKYPPYINLGLQKYGEKICQINGVTLAMSIHITLSPLHTKGNLEVHVLKI